MASRTAVVLGFGGLGILAAGVAAWLLAGGEAAGPAPEDGAAPEAPAAAARKQAPASGPAAPAAPAPAAGDGSIRGRLVRGMAKTPLAGTVTVSGAGSSPLRVESGPDGRFVLDGAPIVRPLVLHAEAAGLLPAEVPVRVPGSGILDIGDLVLGGPVLLEVRVRDSSDRPVAGAAVTLHRTRIYPQGGADWISMQFEPRDGAPASFTRASDEQGRASFEEAAPGSWTVRAAARGFASEGVSVSLVEGALREPVRIVLGPASVLTGSVLDRDGKPAEGVLVRGFRLNAWWGSLVPEPTFRTAADGKYRLEGLSRGPLSLAVELTPGVRLTAGFVEIPDVATWDIRLGPTAGLRGKVVDDATGTPVPGVEITAQAYPETGVGTQGTARTVSGEDGSYLFAGLPPGNLSSLNVRARGFLPYPTADGGAMGPQTRLLEGEIVEREIRLRRGAALRGKALDRAGKPVAGAMVRFKSYNPRMGIEESPAAKTDAEGAFRIEGVSRLKGLLRAEAPGYFQPDYPVQEWQVLQQGTLPEACSLEMPAEGEGVKDVLLVPGGSVEGLVVDRDGKPAAGMAVSVYSKAKGGGSGAGSLTDAGGKFRVEGAAPGEDLVAGASGPGGLRGVSDPFRLGEGESAPGIRIALKAAATLSGRVRREDGATGQGAALRIVPGKWDPNQAWNWNWQRQNAATTPVGADGAFRAEGLATGSYTLVGEADGAAASEGPVVDLAEGEAKEGIEVLLPEEKPVGGRVLNPEGGPVAGAALRAQPAARQNQWNGGPDNEPTLATTDAAGLFTIRGLGKGSWRISVRAGGFGESAQTVEGGKEDLVFNLVAGLTIEGVVTEEGAGTPVPGINVWAHPHANTGGMNQGRSAVTGKDGAFALRDVAPGAWSLTFGPMWDDLKSDWGQKQQPTVEAGTKDLRITVVKGLPISGRVRDEAGKSVTGLWVQASGMEASGNYDVSRQRGGQVQPDGTFRIGGLPAGNYDLTFQSNGMAAAGTAGAAPTTVKGVAAGTEDLVVTVKQGLTISGKVVDEKGNPPGQSGNVRIRPSDDASGAGMQWANFQADGAFTSQPLEPGKSYDIFVDPVAGTMGGSLKGVVPGQKDLVLVLRKGSTLSGRVFDESGKAVPQGVPVTAVIDDPARHNEPGGTVQARTGAGGEFTLAGLLDGRYKLTAGGGNSDYRPTATAEVFEAGSTGVTLRVTAGVAIEGRLVDPKGAWGKTQVWVMAMPEGTEGGGSGGGSWVAVKEDGTFVIKGLAPGRVKIRDFSNSRQTDTKQSDLGTFDAPSTGLVITVPD